MKTTLIVTTLLGVLAIVLWGLGDALAPLMISFASAYLVFPLIKKLENKGISRNKAVFGVFSLFFVIFVLSTALVIPGLFRDANEFVRELPQISTRAINKVQEVADNMGYDLDLSSENIKDYVQEHASELSRGLLKSVTLGIKKTFSGLTKWLLAILNIFLIPLFFFYVINDFEKISAEIKSFIPPPMRPRLARYMNLSNEVLSGYIRGQLLVALCLGVLYAIGLSLIGLRFGILIGLISGLISIIPYAGAILGFSTAILVALANYSGLGPIIGVVMVFAVVQGLEGTLITPKLVGDKVGLSALATMLALIIGGNIFGIVGMVAAVPIAAILKTILTDLKKEYQQLDFYKSSLE